MFWRRGLPCGGGPDRTSLGMRTRTNKIWSRLQRQNGQAFVEFVIVLPILVMLVLGICQFGLAFHNYLSITDATRVGARAAAVKRTDPAGPCAAAQTAILDTLSDAQRERVIFEGDWCAAGPDVGDSVKIKVKYKYEIGLPGFSADGHLEASAEERLE
jgi:TadE-like protein